MLETTLISRARNSLAFVFLAATVLYGQETQFIDFEQFAPPSFTFTAPESVTIGGTTFSGGQLIPPGLDISFLGRASYGTSSVPGFGPTITIDFARPVVDISFVLWNRANTMQFSVADDTGLRIEFLQLEGAITGRGLRMTGARRVTITAQGAPFEFLIDRIAIFFASTTNLELHAGMGSGPQDPTTVTASVRPGEMRTATFPLGALFFIQLVQPDASGNRVPLESRFALGASNIVPAISEPTLFPNHAVIPFDLATTGNLKFFRAIHLGTTTLTITPLDASIQPVTVQLTINRPLRLGSTNNALDGLLVDFAHRRGILADILKGHVRQESNFRRDSYRYEPLGPGGDLRFISAVLDHSARDRRTQLPYSLHRLATADGLAQGTDLLSADISPRSTYFIVRDGVRRRIADTDQFVSAREIYEQNDGTQNWRDNTNEATRRAVDRNPGILDFTAQTPTASSYGLLQILYRTAIVDMAWQGISGARNPSLLFDTDANVAGGSGSLAVGTDYVRELFLRENRRLDQNNPVLRSNVELVDAFRNALRGYNPGLRRYADQVLDNAGNFAPVLSGPIF